MNCVYCESKRVVKNGRKKLKTGQVVQSYLCNECGGRFNERNGTPMARLRTPVGKVEMAIRVRGEGLGIRATARVLGKSPSSITNWEKRLSNQLAEWSPKAPEGDELYTRVGENLLPPPNSRKVGQSVSWKEKADTGWKLKQEGRIGTCLSRE